MALDLYREVSTGTYVAYSRYGEDDGLLPITSTHDGTLGEFVELKIFVRNDDITEWYSNITVRPVCNTSPDETDGITTGYGIKLFAGDTQPTEAEWEATDYANTINIDDIGEAESGDVSTYSPFWYRAEVPAGSPINNRENIVLKLNYVANVT